MQLQAKANLRKAAQEEVIYLITLTIFFLCYLNLLYDDLWTCVMCVSLHWRAGVLCDLFYFFIVQRELLLGGGEESTVRRPIYSKFFVLYLTVFFFLLAYYLLLKFVIFFQDKSWDDFCRLGSERPAPTQCDPNLVIFLVRYFLLVSFIIFRVFSTLQFRA